MSNLIKNMVLDKSGFPFLEKYLDVSSLRHKLISGNIANVSTPGYKSSDVDFHGELKKAIGNDDHLKMTTTHEGHLPGRNSADNAPEIQVDKTGESNGINNVNIDKEMANLAENQIYYSIGARLLANKFAALHNAIKSK
jgi:flagellar basal-body rod protein FlgB